MILTQGGFHLPSPGAVGLEGDRSRCIVTTDGCAEAHPKICVGNRKPRLSNSDGDSESEVDYERTPVGKAHVAPTRSAPTRAV